MISAPTLIVRSLLVGNGFIHSVFVVPNCAFRGVEDAAPYDVLTKNSPSGDLRGSAPQMPCRPNYNLHEKAGGSPKFCFAASNIRFLAGRPAIRRIKSASLIRNVGLMGHEV